MTFFCCSVYRNAVDGILEGFREPGEGDIVTFYYGCEILSGQNPLIRQSGDGAGFQDIYFASDRDHLKNVTVWFQEDLDVSHPAISSVSVLPLNTDTLAEAKKVHIIKMPSKNTLAVQSKYKHLGRSFKDRLFRARKEFEAAGLNFRADQTSITYKVD